MNDHSLPYLMGLFSNPSPRYLYSDPFRVHRVIFRIDYSFYRPIQMISRNAARKIHNHEEKTQ